ncbi:RhuM family protein [Providencia sp. JUb39]|uniref:RhuM family protein n=1 Tax=Providencia sp. JUb39 TaxID=2724165 RepID=UPI001C9CF1B6
MKFQIVRLEGNGQASREVDDYSLLAILAVGYRARSVRGTKFVRELHAFQYRNRAFFNLGKTRSRTNFSY